MLKCIEHFYLKLDSHLLKILVYLPQWKPFKKMKNAYLFHVESSFTSQDI